MCSYIYYSIGYADECNHLATKNEMLCSRKYLITFGYFDANDYQNWRRYNFLSYLLYILGTVFKENLEKT